MKAKENQRVMLTKRLLKESLLSILEEKAIYQISIQELCQRAGINRSTFYKYYGSQYDLLKAMEDDLLMHVEKVLANQHAMQGTQAIYEIFSYLENNIQLSRALIKNNVDPEFPQRLFHLRSIQKGLFSVLQNRFGEDEMEYVTTFVTYGCYNLVRQWMNKEQREPLEKIVSLLLGLIAAPREETGVTSES